MKIKDIRHIETNKTRADGRYPLRIGCTVEFYLNTPPIIGEEMYLSYVRDKYGNKKDGVYRSSLVTDIIETDENFIVETLNSIYELEK